MSVDNRIEDALPTSGIHGDPGTLEQKFRTAENFVPFLAHEISIRHPGLGPDELRAAAARLDALAFTARHAAYAARLRAENYEIIPQIGVTIVSLGFDCMPIALASKYGLIGSWTAGRMPGPFDAAIHSLRGVALLLEADFAGYTNAEDYFVFDGQMACNNKLGVTFNHDRNPKLFENNFAMFMRILGLRVAAFRKAVLKPNVLFVVSADRANRPFLPRLLEVVAGLYPAAHTVAVVGGDVPPDTDAVSYIRADAPRPDYVWYHPLHYATPEGEAFETKIVERLVEVIRQVGGRGA